MSGITPDPIEGHQRVVGIAIKDLRQFAPIFDLCPSGWNDLLAAIRPPIRIVEIERGRHAGGLDPLQATLHIGEIAVLGGIAVRPDSDAGDVGAVLLEQSEEVFGLAALAVDSAAIVHFVGERKIGTEIEIMGRGLLGRRQNERGKQPGHEPHVRLPFVFI